VKKIIFVWDNFGPIHNDRASAVAERYPEAEIIGLELYSRSETYDWIPEMSESYKKITINSVKKESELSIFFKLVSLCLKNKGAHVFFCHYERWYIFATALILRGLNFHVYVMNDSKFDDYERNIFRELIKFAFYTPYNGGLASGVRAKDYLRFLGVPKDKIKTNYNSLSLSRVRRDSSSVPAPNGTKFQDRYFLIIARLVEKKNLFVALDAYKKYINLGGWRSLKILGSGPLKDDLISYVNILGLNDNVIFCGFVQTESVAKELGNGLCVLLLSTEEQFGIVIIEAQAMGLPCIVSVQCGARDQLIRTGVNGFIVEESNSDGVSLFMRMLCENESMWVNMCDQVNKMAYQGDVSVFSDAVHALVSE